MSLESKSPNSTAHKCTICKFYDAANGNNVSDREMVFDESGNSIKVDLCRHHAVELFRMGQRKFFVNHSRIAQNIIGFDEDRLIGLMLRTASRNDRFN